MRTLFLLLTVLYSSLAFSKVLKEGSGALSLQSQQELTFTAEADGIIVFKNQPASLRIHGVPATELRVNNKLIDTPPIKWFYTHVKQGDKLAFRNTDARQKTLIQYYFNSFGYIYVYLFNVVVAFVGALVGFAFYYQYRDRDILFRAIFAAATLTWNITHAFSFSLNFFAMSFMCGLYLQIQMEKEYKLLGRTVRPIHILWFNIAFITVWVASSPWLSLDANRIITLLANAYSVALLALGLYSFRKREYLKGFLVTANTAWISAAALKFTYALFASTVFQSFSILLQTFRLISGSVRNEKRALEANLQLEALNSGLEEAVKDRTKELSEAKQEVETILRGSSDGIFVVETSRELSPGTSTVAWGILDAAGLKAGAKFIDLVRVGTGTEEVWVSTEEALNAIMGEPEVAFEFNEHLLPRDLGFGGRKYHAGYSPLSTDGTVHRLIVTLHDQTEVLAALAARARESLVTTIVDIKSDVPRFLKLANGYLKEAKASVVGSRKKAASALHTLKGDARTRGFKALSELVHKAEDALNAEPVEGFLTLLGAIEQALTEISQIYVSVSPKSEVSLNQKDAEKALREGKEREFIISNLPALGTLAAGYATSLRNIAADLGKPAPRLAFQGDNVRLFQSAMDALDQAMVHVLRNAMDHGIEGETERKAKGKAPSGTVSITGLVMESSLMLTIEDDGRGLNLERIRTKALAKGLIAEGDTPDCNEVAELIFAPEFSTAAGVTQMSGRGVGMDAVRQALETIGGSVRADTKSDGQWKLIIEIPGGLFVA